MEEQKEVKEIITINVEMEEGQAWALAQFLKRVTFNDVRSNAIDENETYVMLDALNIVRKALVDVGVAPR